MTPRDAYKLGFANGVNASRLSAWHDMEAGAAYEAGAIDVHQAFDELVSYATEAEKHARKHGPWKQVEQALKKGGKEIRKAYRDGVGDGTQFGALRRLQLDPEGRRRWDRGIAHPAMATYDEIEARVAQSRTKHGLSPRVANMHPQTAASLGAAGGAALGRVAFGAVGLPGGSIVGGALGGHIGGEPGYKRRSAVGGGVGGILGPLGAALGGYIAADEKDKTMRNPDISHLFAEEAPPPGGRGAWYAPRSKVLAAEREGANVLIIRSLPDPLVRVDGEEAILSLEHRWLRSPTADLSEVQGAEFTYWSADEYDRDVGLFQQFLMFPNPVRELTNDEGFVIGNLLEGPVSRKEVADHLSGMSRPRLNAAFQDLEDSGLIRKRGREYALTATGAIAEHRWRENMLLQVEAEERELEREWVGTTEFEALEEFGRTANPAQVRSTAAKVLVQHGGNRNAAYNDARRRAQQAESSKGKRMATFWYDVAASLRFGGPRQGERKANMSPRARAALGAGIGAAAGGFFGTMIGGGAGMAAFAASESGAAVAAVPLGGLLGFIGGSVGGGAVGASTASPEGYKRRAAKGGALGGFLGPLGAAGGAYLATEEKDKPRRNNALKRRLLRR